MLATREQIAETIERCFSIGPGEALRECEHKKGYTPISAGDFPWFSSEEWIENCCVSLDGRNVRIVAIIAKNPGTGAFSRMVTGIIRDGRKPVVIDPFEKMQAILNRWNWRLTIIGNTYESIERRVFPQRSFIEKRKLVR